MTIRAQVHRRFFSEHAILPNDAERPAIRARPAAIRNKRVLLDEHRIFGFEQLDGDIRKITDAIRPAILAVPMLVAIKIFCDHIETLNPVGSFLGS